MNRLCISLTAIALFAASLPVFAKAANAEADWSAISRLQKTPVTESQNPQQALAAALHLIETQENALSKFIADYPDSPHCISATINLAHLLAAQSTIENKPELYAKAQRILENLLHSASLPADRKADVAFAQIALKMRRVRPGSADDIIAFFHQIDAFEKAHPADPRIASLLVNASPLLDSQPDRKKKLLLKAQAMTSDAALQHEISDDLKCISFLGKQLKLHFISTNAESIRLRNYRGKIVLLVFFAEWSPPSILVLHKLHALLATLPPSKVQAIGISLDQNRGVMLARLQAEKISWPIYYDGKGFSSPLVRSLGINSLPTLWIFDRHGRLVALNAWFDTKTEINRLLDKK